MTLRGPHARRARNQGAMPWTRPSRRSPPAAPGALKGRVRVPGDKSISHRALILGAHDGRRDPHHRPARRRGRDQHRQGHAGARARKVERTGEGAWRVIGVGVGGFAQPRAPLDFGNSGTGCRLVMGAVAGCPITATFDGDASLRSRPMRRVLDPLERMGARTLAIAEGGRLPLTLQGARDPIPIVYEPPGRLRAGEVGGAARRPRGAGRDHVIENEATRDHTERMLRHFGAEVRGRAVAARMAAASRSRASRSLCPRRSWCRPIRPPPRFRWSPR